MLADAVKRTRRSRWDFSHVDWTWTDAQIAEDLGCTRQRVTQVRQNLGIRGRRDKARERWEKVDWNLCNVEIAEQLGVTVKTVSVVRRTLQKPPSAKHGCSRTPGATTTNARFAGVDWSLPKKEIARQVGCSIVHVYRVQKKLLVTARER